MPEPMRKPRPAPGPRESEPSRKDTPKGTAHLRPGTDPLPARVQYRVTYRRDDWRPTTSDAARTYERRHDAQRFVARLTVDPDPDLSPLTFVRVEVRQVGPWREVCA